VWFILSVPSSSVQFLFRRMKARWIKRKHEILYGANADLNVDWSDNLPRIVVAEIAAIPIGVSLSLLSHHLVAITVIAVSVLAVLSFVAVAVRQRQGRRLVGIGTCNHDNWLRTKDTILMYSFNSQHAINLRLREAWGVRWTFNGIFSANSEKRKDSPFNYS